MHRDKDLWGPDALDYDPDRWLDHRVQALAAHPFAFLPFNGKFQRSLTSTSPFTHLLIPEKRDLESV